MRINCLLLVLFLAVVLPGCKSSAERQDEAYSKSQELVKDYSQRWPAFEQFFKAGETAALKLHDEAAGLDEEARTAKLKEAGQAFGPAFLALRQYDELRRTIRTKMEKLDRTSVKKRSTDSKIRALQRDTDQILEETDEALGKLKPKNEGEGAAEVMRQVSRLQTIEKRVSSVLGQAEAEVRIARSKNRAKDKKQ